MIIRSPLRNRFCAAALGGLLLITLGTAAGCSDDGNSYAARQQEQKAGIQLLKQRYSGKPRLQAIVEEQRIDSDGEATIKFLLANNIDLELSADGLPDGAVIRLFKNRWQINPFLIAGVQGWAVNRAAMYAQGQARDGLPYGVGESFSLIHGVLSPVGSVKTAKPDPHPTGLRAPQP